VGKVGKMHWAPCPFDAREHGSTVIIIESSPPKCRVLYPTGFTSWCYTSLLPPEVNSGTKERINELFKKLEKKF